MATRNSTQQTPPALSGRLYGPRTGDHVYRWRKRPDGTAILQASGEFDQDSIQRLTRALADARNDGATRIRLDLTGVTFADSTFLNTLLRANRPPPALVLIGPLPHHLHRLFALTGTTTLFHYDP
ncbi:STAS domain-containing protein [Streptomyces sp. NPDC057540]|uniref:STAS domain-containing protein n=1 Tax=Streptomyces sp. NPDC057540 TaxID=3346160 RepID=UPI00368578DF